MMIEWVETSREIALRRLRARSRRLQGGAFSNRASVEPIFLEPRNKGSSLRCRAELLPFVEATKQFSDGDMVDDRETEGRPEDGRAREGLVAGHLRCAPRAQQEGH